MTSSPATPVVACSTYGRTSERKFDKMWLFFEFRSKHRLPVDYEGSNRLLPIVRVVATRPQIGDQLAGVIEFVLRCIPEVLAQRAELRPIGAVPLRHGDLGGKIPLVKRLQIGKSPLSNARERGFEAVQVRLISDNAPKLTLRKLLSSPQDWHELGLNFDDLHKQTRDCAHAGFWRPRKHFRGHARKRGLQPPPRGLQA